LKIDLYTVRKILSSSSRLLLLAKTITHAAARSLCDSWASCLVLSIHRSPDAAAAQWTALKYIPEVRSYRWSFNNRHLAHPSPNFHRGSKSAKIASFSTSLNFEPPAFKNAARYPNSETTLNRSVIALWPSRVWPSWVVR